MAVRQRLTESAEQLKNLIASQGLSTGDTLPPERQLAEQLGVARMTVRRAIDALAKIGLINRQPGRGAIVARPPARRRPTVGIVLWFDPALTAHPATHEWMAGVAEYFPAGAYETRIVLITPSMFDESEFPPELRGEGVDALIVSVVEIPAPILRRLESSSLPVIFYNVAGYRPSVRAAHTTGAYRLTRYLLELGHQRIGMINGLNEHLTAELRQGYRRALDEAGMAIDGALLASGPFDEERGYRLAIDMLREARPTALLMGDDMMAIGALRATRELGLQCPRDISVCAFGGYLPAEAVRPALTVARHPYRQAARLAASLLRRMLDGESSQVEHLVELDVIVRDSSTRAPSTPSVANPIHRESQA